MSEAVAGTAEVQTFLRAEADRIDAALAEVVDEGVRDFSSSLAEVVRYALETRGKRLRPILCCAAYRAVAGDAPDRRVYRLACALEVVHTYSLVHDDLPCMDDDDLRRGRPTVHRVFGSPLATVAGAALIPLAVRLLDTEATALGFAPRERGRLIAELCGAAGAEGMVGGQLLDLHAEGHPSTADKLETIHRAKTGALLAASVRLGALAARGSDVQLAAFTEYGQALGLAFQIVDDVLDVTTDSAVLGKVAGRDVSLGKSTYPQLFGVDGARALARRWADTACEALRGAGIHAPELEMLAAHVVSRGY